MKKPNHHPLINTAISISAIAWLALILTSGICYVLIFGLPNLSGQTKVALHVKSADSSRWTAPDINSIPNNKNGELIRYGRELILHTNKYLGPKGKIDSLSNGMNCTNCHLNGGTKFFGNNFSAVASTYPKYRPRYGAIESIEERINDCFERSLNGKALAKSSREMLAIVAYIKWLGKGVKKDSIPSGAGLIKLEFMERAASPEKGRLVYENKCSTCHGANGEGMIKKDSSDWLNPPLWGKDSYNIGAGIYRLGRFAGFVKANMPWGVTYGAQQLTDEEAWDVAAYVNSLPRPGKDITRDWPDISKKAIDHPFGPYQDHFSQEQHKYGPFKPIQDAQQKLLSRKP
jgi:thiosulfate dehydrogenase